jgi:RNA polymerase sigma-32 factor
LSSPSKTGGSRRKARAKKSKAVAGDGPKSKPRDKSIEGAPSAEPEVVEPEIVEFDDDALSDVALETDAVEVKVESGNALALRDSLSAYLADIRRYPVLSREEEHELAVRYHEEGDREAAYSLVTANLRLVVMIAREYQRAFQNLLDLIQEGNVGLLEAVKQFDPYRGVRFPSYAVWWIRAYIIRHVMNNFRLVKVGTTQAQRRLFFNLQKEKARLEAEGFKPTPERIAERLGVKPKEVIEMEMRMGSGSEFSVDAPVSSEGATTAIELIPNDNEGVEKTVADREFFGLMKIKLAVFRETLEGRDLEIFDERLLAEDPLTLQDLGDRYGVSRERVRQVEEALKKRLREFLVEAVKDEQAFEVG